MSSRGIVKLDIGGTVFKTTKSTLTKFEGFFKIMFEIGIPIEKDESGCIFVDRSPQHFDRILNYMRDAHVELPDSLCEVKDIRKEAEYYAMDGLMEICDARIPDEKLRFIKTDDELLEIITNIVKPVFVFHYPVDESGAVFYPKKFDVNCFLEKYQDQFDIYFKRRIKVPQVDCSSWAWTIYETTYSYKAGSDPEGRWYNYSDSDSDSDNDSNHDERSSFMKGIEKKIEELRVERLCPDDFSDVFANLFDA